MKLQLLRNGIFNTSVFNHSNFLIRKPYFTKSVSPCSQNGSRQSGWNCLMWGQTAGPLLFKAHQFSSSPYQLSLKISLNNGSLEAFTQFIGFKYINIFPFSEERLEILCLYKHFLQSLSVLPQKQKHFAIAWTFADILSKDFSNQVHPPTLHTIKLKINWSYSSRKTNQPNGDLPVE